MSLNFTSEMKVSELGDTTIVKVWNWPYEKFLEFQSRAQDYVIKNPSKKIYIFCNHPHVFTIGRGNERGRKDLVDFDKSLQSILPYPLHNIHRGGGITFHYPGQWIFYPIVKLSSDYTLDDHMCWVLKSVKAVLSEDLGLEDVITANRLMGIWRQKRKLASIGVGLKRFVTEHGLALNLIEDIDMNKALKQINPCGLDSTTYDFVSNYYNKEDLVEKFHNLFLKRYFNL